ncbi:MAG TPA: hypothetical protein VHW73_14195 [Rudaea sp.]|jgi:hypothetical protein|nr:hypothetical protein [Rudaea sp.]
MMSILIAAVFAVTPFYKPPPSSAPPPSRSGNSVPHVMPDHHRGRHHRRYYSTDYIDGYSEPDNTTTDAADEDEQPIGPAVIYRPAPPVHTVDETKTFPTFSTIVVKGAPPSNGCTYKAVMTDDEINACKRVARNALNQAN